MSDLLASGRLALAVATTAFADDMPPFKITDKSRAVARACHSV